MMRYAPVSPSSSPRVRRVTNLPCKLFFGMTYSDIGAKSKSVGPKDESTEETVSTLCARERDRDAERERDRASSESEVDEMRFSGT